MKVGRLKFIDASLLSVGVCRPLFISLLHAVEKGGLDSSKAAKACLFICRSKGLFYGHMARRLHNWSYRDVTDFIKSKGFSFCKELGGSHQAWIKREPDGGPNKVVEINFRHRAYPPGTLKTIIRQSGIAEKEWVEWTLS